MSPSAFWDALMSNVLVFITRIYNTVYLPLFNTIIENPILILVFGFMVITYVISYFGKMS